MMTNTGWLQPNTKDTASRSSMPTASWTSLESWSRMQSSNQTLHREQQKVSVSLEVWRPMVHGSCCWRKSSRTPWLKELRHPSFKPSTSRKLPRWSFSGLTWRAIGATMAVDSTTLMLTRCQVIFVAHDFWNSFKIYSWFTFPSPPPDKDYL